MGVLCVSVSDKKKNPVDDVNYGYVPYLLVELIQNYIANNSCNE